ncbi:MAG: hypothetical protein E6R03_14740 [Hyphomicrobiaceae bacterium]|nr:MAG: hypothetical protein E6R03_14740 [Hyphomicrobiaceae bacterium]
MSDSVSAKFFHGVLLHEDDSWEGTLVQKGLELGLFGEIDDEDDFFENLSSNLEEFLKERNFNLLEIDCGGWKYETTVVRIKGTSTTLNGCSVSAIPTEPPFSVAAATQMRDFLALFGDAAADYACEWQVLLSYG